MTFTPSQLKPATPIGALVCTLGRMREQDVWTYTGKFDRRERARRVERNVEVVRWLSEYEGGYFSSQEAALALSEAKDAYIYGLPLASMFASHVACERLIAGLFGMLPDD